MKLIRGLHNLKQQLVNGCIAAIGNYDGVHLGHQQILRVLQNKTNELKLPAVVIIFEPQPGEFFNFQTSFRLTSLCEKIQLFSQYNFAAVVVLPFTTHFSQVSATQFVEQYLLNKLQVKYLIVGDDFSFGHDQEGDWILLNRYVAQSKLQVERIPSFQINGVRVSSSSIRTALLQGDFVQAEKFLGRSYQVKGRVVHGQHLGSDLGIPTANLYFARRQLPLHGVYIVKVYGISAPCLSGIANVGFCPTVGRKRQSCEVHVLDFNANLYDKKLTIEFCKKIRDEQKFNSLVELQLQIRQDVIFAKKILGMR